MDPLNNLGEDVFCYLLGNFIPAIQIATTLRLVSKNWCQFVDSERLWKHISTIATHLAQNIPNRLNISWREFYKQEVFIGYPYKLQEGRPNLTDDYEGHVGFKSTTNEQVSIFIFHSESSFSAARLPTKAPLPSIPQLQMHLESGYLSEKKEYWHVFEGAHFSLQHIFDAEIPLDFEVSLFIAHEILIALAHLQKNQILFNFLRPETIKISDSGQVKLSGILLPEKNRKRQNQLRGPYLSSVYYFSPEEIEAHELSAGTDIWAWGVLLIHLLAGQTPYMSIHPMQALFSIPKGRVKPTNDIQITPEIKPIIELLERKTFNLDPKKRHTAEHLLKHLDVIMKSIDSNEQKRNLSTVVLQVSKERTFEPSSLHSSFSSQTSSDSYNLKGSWGKSLKNHKQISTSWGRAKTSALFPPNALGSGFSSIGRGKKGRITLVLSQPKNPLEYLRISEEE